MTAIRICPPTKWGLLEKEPLSPTPRHPASAWFPDGTLHNMVYANSAS